MADISQLVQNAKNGDSSAFGQLYLETCRVVYFTCLSFTKNEEDAKDVMQDVYITAFEKLDTLIEPEKFGAWINRIAVNMSRNHLVKKGAHPEVSVDEEGFDEQASETLLPDEYLENAEKRRRIMEIIRSSLSDAQYQTVIMFYFDGMSIAEIAESMGCPEGTVKYRLNAARAKIKKAVLNYEEENDEKLHAFVGIPFLTRLLYADANSKELPRIDVDPMLPNNLSIPDYSVPEPNVSTTAVNGGKAMLNSLKAKIIAGACAAAVVGGGVTAGVVIANNSKKPKAHVTTSQPAPAVTSGGTSGGFFSLPSGGGTSKPQSNPQIDLPDTPEPAPGLWEYMHISDGITISKYNGNEEYIVVPSELDGNKVLAVEDPVRGSEMDYVFSQFGRTNNAKEIVLPEGITRIGFAAFGYLENLETVHIPDSVTSIGYGAFSNCTSIDNVIFPEGETDFEFVFDNCKSLKTVKLPESAETLWNTFYACESLESVTIPANVTDFEIVFERCTSLKDVTFEGNKIKEIGNSSFINCTSLESIVIPDGVEKISYYVFSGCTSLKDITLPSTLTEIKNGAFEGCTSLVNITLPDSVSNIEMTAFTDCTNVHVTYKGNVYDYEHIGDLYTAVNGEE